MKQKPFDISYRKLIEQGKVAVYAGNTGPMEIIDWEANTYYPIVARLPEDHPNVLDRGIIYQYKRDGSEINHRTEDLVIEIEDWENSEDPKESFINKYAEYFKEYETWDGDYNTCVKFNMSEFLSFVGKVYDDITGSSK